MRHAECRPQQFHGYLSFEDPDWWRGFGLSEACARAIEEFRDRVQALRPDGGYTDPGYEESVTSLWEAGSRAAELMQWHAKRNIVLMLEIEGLFAESAGKIMPVSTRIQIMRRCLQEKGLCIRSFLERMHDVQFG